MVDPNRFYQALGQQDASMYSSVSSISAAPQVSPPSTIVTQEEQEAAAQRVEEQSPVTQQTLQGIDYRITADTYGINYFTKQKGPLIKSPFSLADKSIFPTDMIHINSKVKDGVTGQRIEFDMPLHELLLPVTRNRISSNFIMMAGVPSEISAHYENAIFGTVHLSYKGKSIGNLRYYFIQPPPDNWKIMLNIPQDTLIPTGPPPNPVPFTEAYIPFITNTKMLHAGQRTRQFDDYYTYSGPFPLNAMPDIYDAIKDYYAFGTRKGDLEKLIEIGLTPEQASKEINRINLLNAEFPLNTLNLYWSRYCQSKKKYVGDILNAYVSPMSKVRPLVIGVPTAGAWGVLSYDMNILWKAFKKYVSSSHTAFKALLDEINEALYQVECRRFNFSKAYYLIHGGTVTSIIPELIEYYNDYQERQAEKAEKRFLPVNIISGILSAVPGPLMAFGLSLQASVQYSNLEKIRAEKEKIEEKREAVEERTEQVQKVIKEDTEDIVIKESEQAAIAKSQMKKWGGIVGGIAAAGLIAAKAITD